MHGLNHAETDNNTLQATAKMIRLNDSAVSSCLAPQEFLDRLVQYGTDAGFVQLFEL